MGRGFPLSREATFLLLLCALDTISSAVCFHFQWAVEGNPVLRPFAEAGMLPFVAFKTATFLPAIVVAEWYRSRSPEFVRGVVRWAGYLYLGIYTLFVSLQFRPA